MNHQTVTWHALVRDFRPSWLGFLPDILLPNDPRSVKEQLEDRYAHGGGWRPIEGFRLQKGKDILLNPTLRFPGDPPFKAAAMTTIGEETVIYYPLCSLLAVVAKDGTWEVTRVD